MTTTVALIQRQSQLPVTRSAARPLNHKRVTGGAEKRPLGLTPKQQRTLVLLAAPIAVALTTWLLDLVARAVSGGEVVRPFGIAYIIPVAIITLAGGWKLGSATLGGSAICLDVFLAHSNVSWGALDGRNVTEVLFLLGVGSIVIYGLESARRASDLRAYAGIQANKLAESEKQRNNFNRDVLLAVTGGRLLLCSAEELSRMVHGEANIKMPIETADDVTAVRSLLRKGVREEGFSEVRIADLMTAVSEAATNAIKHAGCGAVRVWRSGDEVTVLVSDEGHGISPTDLARATLEQGYSTRSTLGIGFTLMLQFVDQMALSTGPGGTTILLRVSKYPPLSPHDTMLASYGSLSIQ